MSIAIRPATADDLSAIVAMARELNTHEGIDPTLVEPEGLLEHGFGPRPCVFALIAEADGASAGYALFQDFFDTDRMRPALFLLDLFVRPCVRRQGVGGRLMSALAAEALARGAARLAWGVRFGNSGARAFYRAIEANNEYAGVIKIAGDALDALAARAGR